MMMWMTMMKRAAPLGAVVTALVGATGCPPPQVEGKVVALGAVIDQTGSIARPAWRDAVFLAIEHANQGLTKAGGHKDLAYKLEFSDSTNTTTVAVDRALELVQQKNVKGLVADTSGDTTSIVALNYDADEANDLNVPIICMACTSPNLGDADATNDNEDIQEAYRDEADWNFRTSAQSDPEAVALLNSAAGLGDNGDTNGDGIWKIALYAIDDGYGNGFFDGFVRAQQANYPNLIFEKVSHPREVDANTYDWAADLELLTDDGPDAPPDAIIEVTFPLFAASITRVYVEAGATIAAIPFLHHHNWRHDQTLIKLESIVLEGHEGVSHAIVDNCETSGKAFRDGIVANTGNEPGFWDSATYDAAFALALATLVAVEDNGLTDPSQVTGTQVRDALFEINDKSEDAVTVSAGVDGFAAAVQAVKDGLPIDYAGASGSMDFDEEGNVRNKFVKFRVQDGKFVDVETYDCDEDTATCPTVAGACTF